MLGEIDRVAVRVVDPRFGLAVGRPPGHLRRGPKLAAERPERLEIFDFEAELRLVIARKCREEAPPGLLDRIRERLATEAGGTAGFAPA